MIRDYAQIICDSSKNVFTLDHRMKLDSHITIELNSSCQEIEIFVENMGRLSDLTTLKELKTQRKGLLSRDAVEFTISSTHSGSSITSQAKDWNVNLLDFSNDFIDRFSFSSSYIDFASWDVIDCKQRPSLPIMAYSRFRVNKTNNNDVYLLLENFQKGIVLLNGNLLGKYWTGVAPLLTLFAPGYFLFDGINELILFDMHGQICEPIVYVSTYPVLNDYKIPV